MRAIDPRSSADAARRLSGPEPGTSPPQSPPGLRFEQHLQPQLPAAQSRPPSHKSAMLQFEAFVLQSFIEPMLPSSEGVYGGGTAGSFWKSMLAEKLAAEMAKSGGIGIAKHIMRDGSGV